MPICEKRLQSGRIRAAIEIPPGFGRDIERGRPAWVGAWVDGAMPFRADTIRGYLQAMHQLYLTDPAVKTTIPAPSSQPAPYSSATAGAPPPYSPRRVRRLESSRFKYNQDFESVYAMVPSSLSMLLALFPAILMALAIVREKELGLDHQSLRDSGHAGSNFCSASSFPISASPWRILR